MKLEVNGIPVEVEVTSVGPADLGEIEKLKDKINENGLALIDKESFVGELQEKAAKKTLEDPTDPLVGPENKKELSDIIGALVENAPDVIEDVKEIFEENKDPEVESGMKPWYKSKTIISNLVAAAGCILGVFVSDSPEASMYLPGSIIATINLYLRSITKSEIKLPLEDKLKGVK